MGGGRTGLGVCLVPFIWKSVVVVELERPENVESDDMWEVNELTEDGSPPKLELPFMLDPVFRAKGCAEPFWLGVVCVFGS